MIFCDFEKDYDFSDSATFFTVYLVESLGVRVLCLLFFSTIKY